MENGALETPAKGRQMDEGKGTTGRGGTGMTSPLRKNPTQFEIYSAKADAKGSTPYPRGPPMTDTTNVHSGQIPMNGGGYTGPLCQQDERELV